MLKKRFVLMSLFICLSIVGVSVHAQTTAFNYQGSLKNGGTGATGSYDFEFLLFDSASGGSQVGPTITATNVAVTSGVFTVKLDFGSNYPGADRYLEIHVRTAGGGAFTPLAPRQAISNSPYSIKTISADFATNATNAQQLGGVAANQFVQTNDARLFDQRNPLPNSPNYIQNQSGSLQAANFNIAGNGFFGGNVGIGTTTAVSPLSIAAPGYGLTHTSGAVTAGTYVNSQGGWYGTKSNHPLFFFTNDGSPNVTLTPAGNVGIGDTLPRTRLTVTGGTPWTNAGWSASINMQNASALGWEANPSGQRFGIGQTGGGLYFFRSNSAFGNTANPANYIMTLTDGGSVGINKINPLATLDVNGAVSADSYSSPSTLFLNANSGGRIAFRTSGPTERMTILDNGNVGIGVTNPQGYLLNVGDKLKLTSDTLQVPVINVPTTQHVCYDTFASMLRSCGSAAEYVPAIDSGGGFPETGDLVSIVPDAANPYGDKHGPFVVKKSTTPCDENLLGFIVKPESGADGPKLNEHYLPLAIFGYFPAKITLENGPIKRGDPITSSSKAGYGMKATQACKIIGYALEDANTEGQIQVFAHLSEHTATVVRELREEIRRLREEMNIQPR